MVFERYHLRALQMSVARHHPRVFLCNTLQRGAEGVDKSGHMMCLLLDVQLHIHIALVVAAAGGVQLFAHVPYACLLYTSGVQAADGCRCAMGDAGAIGQAGRTIRKIIIANRFGAFLNMPQIA